MASALMHTHVTDVLGQRLVSRALGPGEIVNLADIEAEFGISRTVAREAMRLLESLGMVEVRRRVGLIVADESHWDVLNPRVIEWRLAGPGREAQLRSLLDLRIAVEPTAARLAALNASDEQRERLLELTEALRDMGGRGLGESEEYLRADVGWHQTLLRASGNEMLAALDGVVEAVLVGRTRHGYSPQVPVGEVLDHHDTTARAVAARMPEAAEVCCRSLVTRVRAELVLPDSTVVSPAVAARRA
ncbi:FadR/GntR family transcriptional regulator [Cellulomonas shaoxiangyii]|uniref:FadR family transcriptional regulator n=1 Tax=Cellulomonas shaoxiangyii TaxID=2566013 RepID=A0A4P7SME4_9CELL|nr:FCD domain-containing protein [Cellulomonas shaoxiangyii]QCB94024.1 FadR family transcriptional regulator [Cellulomonas shaoxiangyii]TGY85787.1 FadR family transcriptional regulator [Cellulomonas shaoxiangyii]